MVYEHSKHLAAVIMACKTMKAVDRSVVSPFHVAQWFPYSFAMEKVSLLRTSVSICVTVQGVQHQVALPVITANPWRRTLLSWKSARAQATAFLNEHYPCPTPITSPVVIIKPSITSTISPLIPTPTRIFPTAS